MTSPWLRAGRPLVVGHRGQRAHIPEHTMPSLRAAIQRGAEMIEADALLSRDGQLVLMHDTTVDRTTDGTGPLADLTWAELAELDAGSWFGPEFAGLRLLRAQDLIDLARAEDIALCLEAKGDRTEDTTRVAERLARLVADNDALDWAFVSSFDHHALAAAKAAVPALLLAPERLPEYGPQPPAETVRQALALGAPVIQHRWELISPDLVETLHDAGIAIWAWSTNDAEAVRISLALGVDAIMGDDVDVLVAGVRSHGRVT
ncbi:glycerophosphoryl diester phosphodiesterase [Acrocarpospora corrugata]|uniref:Glycerophosphoryl diester phosphodiesterase n=1 Tax=Acrocarpospora corrugata TaxID=35763 RepID=A0A5M3VYY2_9ACTN|nr:glycerophosphodiester phosphodiesterase family protein [Acrocarpospora corrugata]GES01716.1 glycerophosphoryl diester phosphodiesterase [Acrocarpospora corrugata]